MTTRWSAQTHLKIHQNCGGLVRWVEAYDQPGVGFTGECVTCHTDGIPVERILPFELPDGMACVEAYNALDIEDLRGFEWDPEEHSYKEKQAEFRKLIKA